MFQLAILVADELPAKELEFSGALDTWFIQLLSAASEHISFTSYTAHTGHLPASADAYDGYLITGSAEDSFAPINWVRALGEFAITAQKCRPVIGVCFGHQLLHHYMGGTVGRAGAGWGIGVQRYAISQTAPWMTPGVPELALLASHQDQVITAAPGSTVHASSEFCPVAVSTIGSNILTFQPHPEMTKEAARALYARRRERIGPRLVDTAVTSLDQPVTDSAAAGWMIKFLFGAAARETRALA